MQSTKEGEKQMENPHKMCSKCERPQGMVSTHRGDSGPARRPPCPHSACSCGSAPCALPANCAACSSGHSSCTCEASPLWREWECLVRSTAAHLCYQHHIFTANCSWDGKTTKKGYSSPMPSSQPRFPHAHTSHPLGTWLHQLFTLIHGICRSNKRWTCSS